MDTDIIEVEVEDEESENTGTRIPLNLLELAVLEENPRTGANEDARIVDHRWPSVQASKIKECTRCHEIFDSTKLKYTNSEDGSICDDC